MYINVNIKSTKINNDSELLVYKSSAAELVG